MAGQDGLFENIGDRNGEEVVGSVTFGIHPLVHKL
jgi:hypothetical protein